MAAEGTGGLSTVALELLIDGSTDTRAGARAELAALQAAVERHHKRADMLQGALEDAARHIGPPEDHSRNSDDGMWDLASRIAWVLRTFGEPEIADGRGAAGARDETARKAAAWDWAWEESRIDKHPTWFDERGLLGNALAAVDALRAGGAGETTMKEAADGGG